MNLKGFFGCVLMIIGLNIIVLAGFCVLVDAVFHLKGAWLTAGIFAVGLLVSWMGVKLMNMGSKERAAQKSLPPDEDRQKELESAMKGRAEAKKKEDEADKGKT